MHALAWPRLEQTAFYDAPFLLTTLHAVSAATRSFVLAGDGAFGFTFLASHVRSMITCLPAGIGAWPTAECAPGRPRVR